MCIIKKHWELQPPMMNKIFLWLFCKSSFLTTIVHLEEVKIIIRYILVYQLVLPHGLIRINIRIRLIIIISYLTSFSSIKYSKTYSKIYIFIIQLQQISFCAHSYVFNICLVELFICVISSIIHDYMVTYNMVLFLYK